MKKIICNPLNLEYRYQIKEGYAGKAVFREAADPTVVLFKDRYLLFASMSGGFWYSDDLHSWDFKETPELPCYDYAPDVRVIDGTVIFSASDWREPCAFFRSEDPLSIPFSPVSASFSFWDPDIFQDDDGRVYFYWGCTNTDPIWGIELDAKTLEPMGEKVGLVYENDTAHVWERTGENNIAAEPVTEMDKLIRQHIGTKPFIEGAFMTKHEGRYYLQYAAPGTQYNTYADGVYVGEAPLGPFAYQAHNPFSARPGGFIQGAGHGNTFQDKFGNWWHVSTMRISKHENFERRLGLFPCGFDADGVLYCNQSFADYPFALPQGKVLPQDIAPEWMLLSYGKHFTASSCLDGHEAALAGDESIRSWWAAARRGADEWLQVDLGGAKTVHAVQLNFADEGLEFPAIAKGEMRDERIAKRYIEVRPQRTVYTLEGSETGSDWQELNKAGSGDYAHDLVVLPQATTLRYLRVCGIELPYGGLPAISGLRVFGRGAGQAPPKVEEFGAACQSDGSIALTWDAAPGAGGYNVRYGVEESKLYAHWQVNGANSLDLSMVNAGTPYFIAVDSFNENGVAPGTVQFCK